MHSKWPTSSVSRGRQTKSKESPSVLTELGVMASNLSMGSVSSSTGGNRISERLTKKCKQGTTVPWKPNGRPAVEEMHTVGSKWLNHLLDIVCKCPSTNQPKNQCVYFIKLQRRYYILMKSSFSCVKQCAPGLQRLTRAVCILHDSIFNHA